MLVNKPQDVAHKIQLLRLLTAIVDDSVLSSSLYFKGGTCAAMSGFINRFSVDLDFDLKSKNSLRVVRSHFHACFRNLDLAIDTEGKKALVFTLKYSTPAGRRNTIRVDAIEQEAPSTTYESRKFTEIDRVVICQTLPSMVAHKLVAPWDRWKKHHAVAGRDVYDIHEFLLHAYPYIPAIITERTKNTPKAFFQKLIALFEKQVTERMLQEDLNTVLPYDEFAKIRKTLKEETLALLRQELTRLRN